MADSKDKPMRSETGSSNLISYPENLNREQRRALKSGRVLRRKAWDHGPVERARLK